MAQGSNGPGTDGNVSDADDLPRVSPGQPGAEGATTPEPLRHKGPRGRGNSGGTSVATEGARYLGRRQLGNRRRSSRNPTPTPWELPVTLPDAPVELFADRHIGPSEADVVTMLEALGVGALDELIDQAVPASIRHDKPLDLDAAASEPAVLERLRELASRNTVATSLIGQGYYGTYTPGVILRNVMENPAWYTAYTPYQPEISQGRLEALLNFQTMVTDLTGMTTANASMLDEGTAVAEAMALARRSSKAKSPAYVVDADTLPQTLSVLRTRAEPLGISLHVVDLDARDA